MKNIMKQFKWVSGLTVLLFAGQAQAAVIMSGSSTFSEQDGIFSGTVFAEITGTAGNYTSMFTLVMDADSDASASIIRDINLSSWQLGAGFNTGATSGGSAGGDPSLAINAGFFGNDALFTFGGLAEGATSASFWFDFADLDLAGDSIAFGISSFDNLSSVNASINLAPIPVPAAVWLFGSGLLGLAGFARRKQS